MEKAESWASSEAVRRNMQANRSRDTGPEMAVRRLLHSWGLRYRVAFHPLAGNRRTTVDIAFTRARVVVLVDGCFWHRCPEHYRLPRTHTDYWQAKIDGNVTRDETTNHALAEAGWLVLRFWEHEEPEVVAQKVAETVHYVLAAQS